ncbi:3-ketoacyl-CoA synthase 17-like [Wolffia australiana]
MGSFGRGVQAVPVVDREDEARLRGAGSRNLKLAYNFVVTHLVGLLCLPLLAALAVELGRRYIREDLLQLSQTAWQRLQEPLVLRAAAAAVSALITVALIFFLTRPRTVYLVDFACYRAPDELRTPFSKFVNHSRLSGFFDESSLEFQRKILERSGLGEETYFPPALHSLPPRPSMAAAREEAEQVMFGALATLFENTRVRPKDIGILIVNCSLFNPTPSLSAMIVNKLDLRSNILSFNLGGMGCSAGVIAIDLAKDLLQVHRGTYALVVSTENITQNWYFGNRKAMLIPNCLFRVGAAAVLLSNRGSDRRRAKYRLVDAVRTHLGADEAAFRCVYQEQDDAGKTGVSLSKDLMAIAGSALRRNITALGPRVLPLSEKLLFLCVEIARRSGRRMAPYVPDFKLAFEHFCIHAGGRAVIDELEKSLSLSPTHVEPSRMTLHRFGNTSSSSIWYELAYIEAKRRVRRGHRVWQIAFGSGFKCNSAVWEALQNVNPTPGNPWMDCIDKYPVELVFPESQNSTADGPAPRS